MGVALSQPVTSKLLYRTGSPLFRVGGATMQGWRYNMEDAHTIELEIPRHPDTALFAVFDGHGGNAISTFVSQEFPNFLSKLKDPHDQKELRKLCIDLDEYAMKKVTSEDGSTGIFVIATRLRPGEYRLTVGNIGDSRVILGKFRNGQLSMVPLTLDHKPTDPKEMERIMKAGGTVQAGRVGGSLALSRAFGDRAYKIPAKNPEKMQVCCIPDFKTINVMETDFLVLACDGIFESDIFTRQGVIQYLYYKLELKSQESQDLAQILAGLLDECLARGSNDNMSALLVQFKDGTDYQQDTPFEYVPGPYHEGERHASFQKAYSEDAELAGYSVEAARKLYEMYSGRSRWEKGTFLPEPIPPAINRSSESQTTSTSTIPVPPPPPPPLPGNSDKKKKKSVMSYAPSLVKRFSKIRNNKEPAASEDNSSPAEDDPAVNDTLQSSSISTPEISERSISNSQSNSEKSQLSSSSSPSITLTSSSNQKSGNESNADASNGPPSPTKNKRKGKDRQRPQTLPDAPSGNSRKYHTWSSQEAQEQQDNDSSTAMTDSSEPLQLDSSNPAATNVTPRSAGSPSGSNRKKVSTTHSQDDAGSSIPPSASSPNLSHHNHHHHHKVASPRRKGHRDTEGNRLKSPSGSGSSKHKRSSSMSEGTSPLGKPKADGTKANA